MSKILREKEEEIFKREISRAHIVSSCEKLKKNSSIAMKTLQKMNILSK